MHQKQCTAHSGRKKSQQHQFGRTGFHVCFFCFGTCAIIKHKGKLIPQAKQLPVKIDILISQWPESSAKALHLGCYCVSRRDSPSPLPLHDSNVGLLRTISKSVTMQLSRQWLEFGNNVKQIKSTVTYYLLSLTAWQLFIQILTWN